MAVWPDVAPDYGYAETEDWRTVVVRSGTGVRQVVECLTEPLLGVTMAFSRKPETLAPVLAFIRSCRGPAVSFGFFSFNPLRVHTGLACGTADGEEDTFTVPVKHPTEEALLATVMYVDGVAKIKGTDWDWTTPDSDGKARALFVTPPLSGPVTADVAGRRFYTVALVDPGQVVNFPKYGRLGFQVRLEEDRTP